MDPSDRNFVLAALNTTRNPPDNLKCLAKQLVAEGIFAEDFVSQHSMEILGIWRDWRQRSALSPPDSNVDGRQDDDVDANSPTGKLALYGPVDNQVKDNAISLFRPRRANFCFAASRRSEGAVSFIQEETAKNNDLEPEDDGTIVIQWKYSGRVPDDFEDRDDQKARHTLCVVLSADEVKEVGMMVDVVFGTSCFADLDQQRSHMPPPPCPTPPRASSSDLDHLDGPARSSFGDAVGAAQQMVPVLHPGNYQATRHSQAEPSSFVQNANNVFIINGVLDPLALVQQLGSSMGNQGAPSVRTADSSMNEAHPVGGVGKRKADVDSQGFGRAKRFHG